MLAQLQEMRFFDTRENRQALTATAEEEEQCICKLAVFKVPSIFEDTHLAPPKKTSSSSFKDNSDRQHPTQDPAILLPSTTATVQCLPLYSSSIAISLQSQPHPTSTSPQRAVISLVGHKIVKQVKI
ncbi:unnamed protein product [Lactuca saligna]|uniref:Uncharacterized protein n=1 Tax=Lactuca saligna TaxID=75948 RepID=A0AA35ZEW6_LACSI|nr:unnamed protein product [Lactuca saligna]